VNVFNSYFSLMTSSFIFKEYFLPELNSTEKRITLIGVAIIGYWLICLTLENYEVSKRDKIESLQEMIQQNTERLRDRNCFMDKSYSKMNGLLKSIIFSQTV
jgi:hypothetical protein